MKSECEILDCLSLFMKEEILEGDESPVSIVSFQFFLLLHIYNNFMTLYLMLDVR